MALPPNCLLKPGTRPWKTQERPGAELVLLLPPSLAVLQAVLEMEAAKLRMPSPGANRELSVLFSWLQHP